MSSGPESYWDSVARKIEAIERGKNPSSIKTVDLGVDGDCNPVIVEVSEEHPLMDPKFEPHVNPNQHAKGSGKYTQVQPINALEHVTDLLPTLNIDRLGSISLLVKELNSKYGQNIDPTTFLDVNENFKAIVDPDARDTFVAYVREIMDRVHLVVTNQLGVTIMDLIGKLTSEETLRSLTIPERVALLDRLFEYLDKINVLKGSVPTGNSELELTEISSRKGKTGRHADIKNRNRDAEKALLKMLKDPSIPEPESNNSNENKQ
jgi:hypothetical protein